MAAFGHGNEDNISLLSTQTTIELDPVEQSFRQALARMVRSAAAVAAPTVLASVPEDPMSREPSTRSRNAQTGRPPMREERNASLLPLPRTRHSQSGALPVSARITSPVLDNATLRPPRMPTKLRDLRVKLKKFTETFKSLPSRFKSDRSTGRGAEAQPTEAERGVSNENSHRNVPYSDGAHERRQPASPVMSDPNARQSDGAPHQANETSEFVLSADLDLGPLGLLAPEQRINWFEEQFPGDWKFKVQRMDKEARAAWIRVQYTAFRQRYVEHPRWRRTHHSLAPSYADSPRNSFVSAPRRPERSQSADILLVGLGTHMDPHPFGPGDLFDQHRQFTISSTTNLSQAATEVPSTRTSIASAVPSLGSNFQHHLETRSRSRPRSVASRLRHSIGRDSAARRSSIDSVASVAASRGFTGLAVQTDGDSVTSIRSIMPQSNSGPSRTSRRSA